MAVPAAADPRRQQPAPLRRLAGVGQSRPAADRRRPSPWRNRARAPCPSRPSPRGRCGSGRYSTGWSGSRWVTGAVWSVTRQRSEGEPISIRARRRRHRDPSRRAGGGRASPACRRPRPRRAAPRQRRRQRRPAEAEDADRPARRKAPARRCRPARRRRVRSASSPMAPQPGEHPVAAAAGIGRPAPPADRRAAPAAAAPPERRAAAARYADRRNSRSVIAAAPSRPQRAPRPAPRSRPGGRGDRGMAARPVLRQPGGQVQRRRRPCRGHAGQMQRQRPRRQARFKSSRIGQHRRRAAGADQRRVARTPAGTRRWRRRRRGAATAPAAPGPAGRRLRGRDPRAAHPAPTCKRSPSPGPAFGQAAVQFDAMRPRRGRGPPSAAVLSPGSSAVVGAARARPPQPGGEAQHPGQFARACGSTRWRCSGATSAASSSDQRPGAHDAATAAKSGKAARAASTASCAASRPRSASVSGRLSVTALAVGADPAGGEMQRPVALGAARHPAAHALGAVEGARTAGRCFPSSTR